MRFNGLVLRLVLSAAVTAAPVGVARHAAPYSGRSLLAQRPDGEVQSSRRTPRTEWSVEPAIGGPAIMAVGDTMSFVVARYRCLSDDCDRLEKPARVRARWRSMEPSMLRVSARGETMALRAGETTLVAAIGGEARFVRASVRILPAVRRLSWTPIPHVATAGDTLSFSVIALDSGGNEVARLAPFAHIGGTGRAGQVLWQPTGTALTPVVLDRPGLLVLVARLAHRVDTLRLSVQP